MIAFPIPTSGDVPPVLFFVLGALAIAGFVVVVVRAVQYFRRGDDE